MLTSLVTVKRNTNFRQCVVNLSKGGAFSEQIGNSGVPLHELDANRFNLPATVLRLASLIRQLSPAAIQSWLYYGDLVAMAALYLSGHRRQTRLFWGIRCSDISQSSYGVRLRLSVAACARLSRFTDAVVANSYAGRRHHEQLGYRPRAFVVIPNGIDITEFRPDPVLRARIRAELNIPDTTVLVIHVARVDEMKDHATFMKVAAAMPNVRFAAIGRGTETLPAPPNMMRLGIRRDIQAIYAAADYLVSTSAFGEAFSNVIAEGMASGVPAIATDVGDAREIIGDTGSVVQPGNPAAITDTLQNFMSEPEDQRRSRVLSCRNRIISRFSLERAVVSFDALHGGAAVGESQMIEGGRIGGAL
jgi:glycosyltransferase involved in cell wall biosynthesis